MISELCNPEFYKRAFLKIRKFMEVREEGMEVQEETVRNENTWIVPSHQRKAQLLKYFDPNNLQPLAQYL